MNWATILLMSMTWIYVDRPVSTIQFVLETTGICLIAPEIETKALSSFMQLDGLHVLVFGLNQDLINGRIAICSGPVTKISGVVGANPDGTDAHAVVGRASSPTLEVTIFVRP